MKPVSVNKKVKWDDVIFARRNKHYGAYLIRKSYFRHIFTAAFIALIITGILITTPMLTKLLIPQEEEAEVVEMVTVKYTELAPPPPIEKNIPPPPKVLIAPPVRNVIKYVEPKVTKQEVVEKEDLPTVDEIKQNDTGAETVKGSGAEYQVPQEVILDEVKDDNKIYEAVEHSPQYEGGMDALVKFLRRNLRYPSRAKSRGVQGVVYVSFVVGSDGKITSIETLKPLDPDCDNEAIRVIKKMPAWKPGIQNGKSVKVRFTLPIAFRFVDADS